MLSKSVFEHKFIPILREGDKKSSVPISLGSKVYHDMGNDAYYEKHLFELIKIINDQPLVKRPVVGEDSEIQQFQADPVLSKAISVSDELAYLHKRKFMFDTGEGMKMAREYYMKLKERLRDRIENYNRQPE